MGGCIHPEREWGELLMPAAGKNVSYYRNYNADDGIQRTVSTSGGYYAPDDIAYSTPDGYEFKEWNTSRDGTGTAYAVGAAVVATTVYAIWEPITYTTTSTELTAVADAIRTKGGTSAALEWPSGFAQAIADIPSGGGVTLYKINGIVGLSTYNSVTIDGTYYNDTSTSVRMGYAPSGATVTVELGYDYIFTSSNGVTNVTTGAMLPLGTFTSGSKTIYTFTMPDSDVTMNPYYDD